LRPSSSKGIGIGDMTRAWKTCALDGSDRTRYEKRARAAHGSRTIPPVQRLARCYNYERGLDQDQRARREERTRKRNIWKRNKKESVRG